MGLDARTALIFAKIANSGARPVFEQIMQLPEDLRQIAILALAAGQDRQVRMEKIRLELMAANNPELYDTIKSTDPAADLDSVPDADSWNFTGIQDALNAPLSPLPEVVRGFLSKPSVSIFFSSPKSLKTLLLQDLAVCISSGIPWLTDRDGRGGLQTEAGICIWVDLENGPRRSTERFAALARGHNLDDGLLWYTSMPRPWPDLSKLEEIDRLKARLSTYQPSLLVIDHFAQILGEIDENTSQISTVMSNLRILAEDCNLALILIHHQVKNAGKYGMTSSESLRGHGSILASCDLAAVVERSAANPAEVSIKPAAVRGAPISEVCALFAYEAMDGARELKSARFFGIEQEDPLVKIHEAILEVVDQNPGINQTKLRAAIVDQINSAGDPSIRQEIARMERSGEIIVKPGKQQSKLYFLKETK